MNSSSEKLLVATPSSQLFFFNLRENRVTHPKISKKKKTEIKGKGKGKAGSKKNQGLSKKTQEEKFDYYSSPVFNSSSRTSTNVGYVLNT